MNHQSAMLYPKLKPEVRLKKLEGYAVAHGYHPSLIRMIHPSNAFFLAFCGGALSVEEIAYLYGETYGIPAAKRLDCIQGLAGSNRMFLETLSQRETDAATRFDPGQFLFPADESVFAKSALGKWPVPAGINITVTFKCNFNCGYCYQDLTQGQNSTWDAARCVDLIDEAADWGVVFFGITGGEPTIFKGWMDVMERGLSRGMIPTITSNGTVIGTDPEIAQRLRAMGLEEMTISLDASKPEIHDAVTRSSGHFPKVINAIRYLVEAGIKVVIKSVLTPSTKDDVEDLIDFTVMLGVKEIGITYMEAGAIGSDANSCDTVTSPELQEIRARVQAKKELYAGVCIIHPPRDVNCAWGEDDWYPCGGLNMGMSIFPTGDVTVCDKMHGVSDFTYGNVFESGLRDIWEGEAFRQLRERTVDLSRVDDDCAQCSKLYQCRTSCFVDSFDATGDYFAKDPNCGGPFFD